jgi:C4-dicarboxylate-specific signal transduction histidine kinase
MQVHQVLLNLVVNSVDAAAGHGSIEIRVDDTVLSSGDAEAIPWKVEPEPPTAGPPRGA